MKICFNCSLYTPHVGGIETVVGAMSAYARANGHDVHILTKKYPLNLPAFEMIDLIPVTRIHMPWEIDQLAGLAHKIGEWLSQNRDWDVIHAVGLRRPLPLFSALMGAAAGIPVVFSACGTDVPAKNDAASAEIWGQGREYIEAAVKSVHTLTAVSNDTRNDVYRAIPRLSTDVRVIPCGIDYREISNSQSCNYTFTGTPYIVSLRRLEPDKGVDVLLDAMRIVIDKHGINSPQLVVAGDGSMKESLIAQAAELRILPWTHFIGTVSHSTGMGLLKDALVCVVPSIVEGGGLVNTEAHAVGCPVVASNTGGIPEYVSPDASILVKPKDPFALAKAIEQYVWNDDARSRADKAGKRFAASRDWSRIFTHYEQVYRCAQVPSLGILFECFPPARQLFDIIREYL